MSEHAHAAAANLGALIDPTRDATATALIDCRDWTHPRTYSHGEIDAHANAVARALAARGYPRGTAIAILSANRAEFLIAYFGIMRAGFVAVPVNHKFPRETIEFVLADSGTRFAFCDSERRGLVSAGLPVCDFDEPGAWDAFLVPGAFTPVTPAPRETAMVLYTSGTTGRPKGVPLSHDGQLWAVRSRLRGGPYDQERLIVAAPLFHMNALGTSKFASAAHACVVLLPQFDVKRYIEAIGRFKVTWLTSVPTMLAMVARERATLAATDVSSVRYARMGSAPTTDKLIEDVKRTFPGAAVSIAYGTTESGPVAFGPQSGKTKSDGELGWPLPDVEVRLVETRGADASGVGANGHDADEGVLWIRTPANMVGYLNLPAKTKEVLTPDGWYFTGDVFARSASGCYRFLRRADDMFVCGGENIYPPEVEQLLERHPDIVQACVVPVPDELKGEKPYAFVVMRVGSSLTEEAVKTFALTNAPAYQHPRGVAFVSEFPLAGTNKVDRKALRVRALELWGADQASAA
ncbi:MAG: class I adenylate-forming enzyme family protein [Burkholderiales bacterium]